MLTSSSKQNFHIRIEAQYTVDAREHRSHSDNQILHNNIQHFSEYVFDTEYENDEERAEVNVSCTL